MAQVYKEFSKRHNKDVWKIDIRIGGVRGTRINRGNFATKREAQNALSTLQQKDQADLFGMRLRGEAVTLGELLQSRVEDPLQTTPGRVAAMRIFEDFVLCLGRSTDLREISTSTMREYRDRLVRRGLMSSSIQTYMIHIAVALNSSKMYFEDMETFRAPSLPGLKIERREKFVPRDELRLVVDQLRRPMKRRLNHAAYADVLELLQMTGARIHEILRIEPSQINFEQRLLVIHGTKTKEKRTIPITDSIEEILRRRTSFPKHSAMWNQVHKIADELGVEFGRDGWDFHDIRHTAASVLAEQGVSHSIIASILGHKLGGMTARYTHARLPAIRDAILKLEDYWNGDESRRRLYVVA